MSLFDDLNKVVLSDENDPKEIIEYIRRYFPFLEKKVLEFLEQDEEFQHNGGWDEN